MRACASWRLGLAPRFWVSIASRTPGLAPDVSSHRLSPHPSPPTPHTPSHSRTLSPVPISLATKASIASRTSGLAPDVSSHRLSPGRLRMNSSSSPLPPPPPADAAAAAAAAAQGACRETGRRR